MYITAPWSQRRTSRGTTRPMQSSSFWVSGLGPCGPGKGVGTGTGAPSSATCVCLPSALRLPARSLDSVACFALPSWHHQSLGLLFALHPRQGPLPPTIQISQSHTESGERWGFYLFLVSVFKNLEILRVNWQGVRREGWILLPCVEGTLPLARCSVTGQHI